MMEHCVNRAVEDANGTTINMSTLIQSCRGFKQQSLQVAIPLTVVNVLIFFTGFIGNIAVCIVIIKHRTLHTATNYYLFNLAISDLTLLIFGLPNDVALYWHQYPWLLGDSFCKIRALISETASYVSVLTVVAFSTERYLAICYPLYLHTMSGLQRAMRIIASLWFIALFCALPISLHVNVNYLVYPPNSTNILPESAICGILEVPDLPVAEASTFVFFIIPMLIIAAQYARMGLVISKNTRKTLGHGLKGSVHRDRGKTQSNSAVIRMLSAVVAGFFLCWAPFHAQRLMFSWGATSPQLSDWMYFITGIFYYFSSTLNPILYNVMSDRMRNAFREVICGVKPRQSLQQSSTMRETCSRSCKVKTHTETIDIDSIKLVNKEMVSVALPDHNTLLYEIHHQSESSM